MVVYFPPALDLLEHPSMAILHVGVLIGWKDCALWVTWVNLPACSASVACLSESPIIEDGILHGAGWPPTT